jgi:glycosyltransferase involved in cell wall biosynthesis
MLAQGCAQSGISTTEAFLFAEQLRQTPRLGAFVVSLRHSGQRRRLPLGATAFGWEDLGLWVAGQPSAPGKKRQSWGPSPVELPLLNQLEMLHGTSPQALHHPRAFDCAAALNKFCQEALAEPETWIPHSLQRSLNRATGAYRPLPGVNVAGYFRYPAGMGHSVRLLTGALDSACVPHTDICLPADSGMRVPGHAHWWTQTHTVAYRTSITVANADQMSRVRDYLGPAYFAGRHNIAFWIWETETLPQQYRKADRGFDAIWTASAHSAEAIAQTLQRRLPIEVIPHPVAVPKQAIVGDRSMFGLPADRLLYGYMFDVLSSLERKNPWAVIDAFRAAFVTQDRACLVLKTLKRPGYEPMLHKVKDYAAGLPVIFYDEHLTDEETQEFMACLDVYVSLHRAEGFGLTLAEAMAQAKPVVATGYSGNMQFMNKDVAHLVPYEIIETTRAHGAYPCGTRWADAQVDAAAESMRSLYLNADARLELGQRAQAHIARTLSPEVVGKQISQALAAHAVREGSTSVEEQEAPRRRASA